jgi:D,D-heptose 1,7-bisphosphate phosphatase
VLRQAVVLVGGLGTRLGVLTERTPKPMLPVGGEPFLDILLRNIARHGFEEILLLSRHHAGTIRDHYASGQIGGARIRVSEEPEKAGTAGALREVAADLDPHFLLSNGDSFFDFNYLALAQRFQSTAPVIALALREVPDAARYGRVTLASDGRLVEYAEKGGGVGRSGLINGGVYIASREILRSIGPGEVSLETDVLPALVAAGRVVGMSFDGYFLDIGVPESYAQAQRELPRQQCRKVVFFDRDGTLNHDAGYTHKVADLTWLPGAAGAIRRCNDAGRLVIVITNQAGIARGLYSEDHVHRFHQEMNRQLRGCGAHIDAFYLCPHHPEGTVETFARTCDCRKPGTSLLAKAVAEWNVDLDDAVMVGDKVSDIEAARAFGIRSLRADGTDLERLLQDNGI